MPLPHPRSIVPLVAANVSAPVGTPSILLLPAGGRDSAQHYASSIERPIAPKRLIEWLGEPTASAIEQRLTDGRLVAWGLSDNTKGLAGSGIQPIIWDRINWGTLALFSNANEYFAAADVVGKGTSTEASLALWGTPKFRWLVLLTNLRDVSIPVDVARKALGYAETYKMNRQNIVPKAWREGALWSVIADYLPSTEERGDPAVREVAVESQAVDAFVTSPAVEPRESYRREAVLVSRLRKWWSKRDGEDAITRHEIRPGGGSVRLYTDLYNRKTTELVEAKATATRSDVRMAIGQLADYARFVPGEPKRVILLPNRPSEDLIDLLAAEGLALLVPDERAGFVEIRPTPAARKVSS